MEPSEWSLLTRASVFGVIFGVVGGLSIWVQRWIKGEPLVKRTKFSSPSTFYAGIALFGGASVMAFVAGMPLFATVFLGIAVLYGVGLIAYRRGWRG